MGKGHLLNVPKFIYEFALDNYCSGTKPDLLVVEHVAHRHKLVPIHQPDYTLAFGSNKEMQICKEVTTSLARQYARDDRIGTIGSEAQTVKKETAPLHAALSKLINEATGQS
jgi:hypothetical protein